MDTSLNRTPFLAPNTTIATSVVRTPDLRGHVSHLTYYPFMYFNLRNEDTSIKKDTFPTPILLTFQPSKQGHLTKLGTHEHTLHRFPSTQTQYIPTPISMVKPNESPIFKISMYIIGANLCFFVRHVKICKSNLQIFTHFCRIVTYITHIYSPCHTRCMWPLVSPARSSHWS